MNEQSEQQANRRPSDSEIELALLMGPNDANAMGNVHGGVIMRLADEAGALAAMRHAGKLVVTVRIDSMTFLEPVRVGYLLQLKARVNWVGNTSIEVGVRVEASNPITGEGIHTNSAYFVYVALDERGRPSPVPGLELENEAQRRRWQEAEERREIRLEKRTQAQESWQSHRR
ncbi:MAG: acyl-CoA thioesterase [Ardenticatenales bacterium]|nr:acyl-CoA thioesterase [Ardenticatenales bacterium]MCB9172480.1 acyl-CoA thioesterase [Ardenticatenales bacterium]